MVQCMDKDGILVLLEFGEAPEPYNLGSVFYIPWKYTFISQGPIRALTGTF